MKGREFAFLLYYSIPDNLKGLHVFGMLVKVAASASLRQPTQKLRTFSSFHRDPSTIILADILSLFNSAGYS